MYMYEVIYPLLIYVDGALCRVPRTPDPSGMSVILNASEFMRIQSAAQVMTPEKKREMEETMKKEREMKQVSTHPLESWHKTYSCVSVSPGSSYSEEERNGTVGDEEEDSGEAIRLTTGAYLMYTCSTSTAMPNIRMCHECI